MSARHRPARREPAVAPVLRLSTLRAPERGGAVEDVRALIGLAVDVGLLAPNERLPSIDEIGATFGVAPITVRRALTALCARGILLARRGRNGGTFVAPEPTRGELEQFAAYRIASTEI